MEGRGREGRRKEGREIEKEKGRKGEPACKETKSGQIYQNIHP